MSFSNKIIILFFIFFSLNAAATEYPNFNVGYLQDSMSNYSAKDLKISMDIWIKSVANKAGYDAKMFFYKDPNKAAADFYAGKIDFITGFPLDFVKYFNTSKLADGFSGGYKKSRENKFVILVKKNSTAKNVHELKNVKVGIQNNDKIMQLYTKLNMPTAKIVDYKGRNRIILDLFFSRLDVAIVPLHNFELAGELNPQVYEKIRVLKQTEYLSNSVGFFRKGFPIDERKNIFDKGLHIFETPQGKQMMVIYKMQTLLKTPVSLLQNAQKLYDTYQKQQKDKK